MTKKRETADEKNVVGSCVAEGGTKAAYETEGERGSLD